VKPKLLLDTHVVVRWLSDLNRLSREQFRVLQDAVRQEQVVGVSAITLVEIALLGESRRISIGTDALLRALDTDPVFEIIPLSTEIARELAALGSSLRDPVDRIIVATARVHRLSLVTSGQRIIESRLTATVE
jgi:PIN domain nuclease of toxin-antitoxin system